MPNHIELILITVNCDQNSGIVYFFIIPAIIPLRNAIYRWKIITHAANEITRKCICFENQFTCWAQSDVSNSVNSNVGFISVLYDKNMYFFVLLFILKMWHSGSDLKQNASASASAATAVAFKCTFVTADCVVCIEHETYSTGTNGFLSNFLHLKFINKSSSSCFCLPEWNGWNWSSFSYRTFIIFAWATNIVSHTTHNIKILSYNKFDVRISRMPSIFVKLLSINL